MKFVISFTNGTEVSKGSSKAAFYVKFEKQTFVIPKRVVLENDDECYMTKELKEIVDQISSAVREIYYYKLSEFNPKYIKTLCEVICKNGIPK